MLPKVGKQKTTEGNRNQAEPSIQKQYMQLLPITPRGHSSESIDNTTPPDYMALSPSTRSWEVPRNKITIDKVIGKGSFGQVAKGTAEDLPGKKKKTMVAIKMLKGTYIGRIFFCASLGGR